MAMEVEKVKIRNLRKWLFGLQKQIGEPIVVSLLITPDMLTFLSCNTQKEDLELVEAEDDTPPDKPLIPKQKLERPSYYG